MKERLQKVISLKGFAKKYLSTIQEAEEMQEVRKTDGLTNSDMTNLGYNNCRL